MSKELLNSLISRFKTYKNAGSFDSSSEEMIRPWINELLSVFDWDVMDPNQVLQEIRLSKTAQNKLVSINSTHIKPDYSLVNGENIFSFVDAKSLDVDLFSSDDAAFQVKSYGWSAGCSFAFATNFEQFVIYKTTDMPVKDRCSAINTIKICIDEYIEKYELINEYLRKSKIYSFNLDKLAGKHEKHQITIDEHFSELLNSFRATLAENLCVKNSWLSNDRMNYYVQVILDRIVFIRVCESRGLEIDGLLKDFIEQGFWAKFRVSCYTDFYEHYDGAMFERDHGFNSLEIDDSVFTEFIQKLYDPYPYRFDVIPTKTLARIYEDFLSKTLIFRDGEIFEFVKDEYVKTNGAIPTPELLADATVKEVTQIDFYNSIDDILNKTFLDPCCGSGIFLVSYFSLTMNRIKYLLKNLESERTKYLDSFVSVDDVIYLNLDFKKEIITRCLYGIDADETAIETAKMSLALKLIEDSNRLTLNENGYFGRYILSDVDKNIKFGNTLIEASTLERDSPLFYLNPLSILDSFNIPFERKGFDYIVGNPPYVETKFYKKSTPLMHQYLANNYLCFEGKADLSVLFIERCYSLLNNRGKLGFVIQKRWFKTDYGEPVRKLLSSNQSIWKIIDFKATDIFVGRTTYIAILGISKSKNIIVDYGCFTGTNRDDTFAQILTGVIPNKRNIDSNLFTSEPWNFDLLDIYDLRKKAIEKNGTLGDKSYLYIKDGIQALLKKIYHIVKFRINDGKIYGENLLGDKVTLELGSVSPVIYNKLFYPFKKVTPDAYCIFPYKGENRRCKMTMSEIQSKYPLCYKYLENNEALIKSQVECNLGDVWETFTREHNHESFYSKKVIIPMTSTETVSTFDDGTGYYMDNSNVWFISSDIEDDVKLKSILIATSCILNSSLFSALAKYGANPQRGGYYKFNKQFLTPVAFPDILSSSNNGLVEQLNELYDEIIKKQKEYQDATPYNRNRIIIELNRLWEVLDNTVFELYGFSKDETSIYLNVIRRDDRNRCLE